MMVLGFDTETTGMWDLKASETAEHQPDLLQLGLILQDGEKVKAEFNCLIQLNGKQISAGAQESHGITEKDSMLCGIELRDALNLFQSFVAKADLIVCHNYDFDSRIIWRSCLQDCRPNFLARVPSFCTMKSMTSVLKLPGARGGWKWPKLQELHKHFFECEFDSAHDAMADVRATMKCFNQIVVKHPELLRM